VHQLVNKRNFDNAKIHGTNVKTVKGICYTFPASSMAIVLCGSNCSGCRKILMIVPIEKLKIYIFILQAPP